MGDIAYQNKDVASKATCEALVGKSLAPFGLGDLKIVGILPTNLPAVESNELRLDNLFLLSDGSVAIIDYESDFSRENFVKYVNYVARVLRRYAEAKQLGELQQLKIVVIYTADVELAEETYDLGGVRIEVEAAYLVRLDSDEVYRRISEKIRNKEPLSEEEIVELMILPLMVKGTKPKQDLTVKAVNLAKQLTDQKDSLRILSGILTFTDKFIDNEYGERVRKEIMMTKVEKLIYEDGLKDGMKQGHREGAETAERKLSQLTLALANEKKLNDIIRISVDPKYREKMYEKYNIQDKA